MKKYYWESGRRILSLLLILVMLVQFVPAMSFAADIVQSDSTFLGFADWSVTDGSVSLGEGVSGNGAQIQPEGKAVLQSSPIAVYAGEKLRVGISVKLSSGGEATLRVQTYGDTAAKVSVGDPVIIGTVTGEKDFRELAGDMTVAKGVKAVCVELVIEGGTCIADSAYVRTYTDLPELKGVMGDGYGVEGQWSLFYPLTYAEGQWTEQKDQTRDPYSYNYAQIIAEGKKDKGAVRFHRAAVYEHVGIAIGSDLVIGEEYTLKMWVRGTASADYNGLSLYANGDTDLIKFGPESGSDGTWQEFTHIFKATRPHFYLFMSGGAYACDVIVDNIRILDSQGNDVLDGAGSFAGDGKVVLSSENRLFNGEFENVDYDYLPLEDFNSTFQNAAQDNESVKWTLEEPNGTLKIDIDDDGKHLSLTRDTADSKLLSPPIAIEGGKTYQLSLRMKTTGKVALQGAFYDKQDRLIATWDPSVFYTGKQWAQVKEQFTSPENTATFVLHLVLSGPSGATLQVDNVAINPCVADEVPVEDEDPVTYPEDPGKIPVTIDPHKLCSMAYAFKGEWTAFYPTGTPGDTWPEWDQASHYGQIVKKGCHDAGALHLVSTYYKNAGVGINAGMTVGEEYTLGMWIKGYSNAGRVFMVYGNGDPIIVESYENLPETWTYVEVRFTATSPYLFLAACDWGMTDIYIDNITLKSADGIDLLAGNGDFWKEAEPETTQPESTEPGETEPEDQRIPISIDPDKTCNASSAFTGIWTAFYPTGIPGDTWPQWDLSSHYGEIVAEGYKDPGALHLKSNYYKNAGVGIHANMIPGKTYKLGLWAKGTSDAGRVLALYGNGDPNIIEHYLALMADWNYYEIEFTANSTNLYLVASDWGVTDIYIDNITLTDTDGVDLLSGSGDFCKEAEEPEVTEPGATDPDAGKIVQQIAYDKLSNVSLTYAGVWTPFCPTGTPGDTWPLWDQSSHYAWVVEEGCNDFGSLYMKSAPGKNVGVATKAGMVVGQEYTLGLWVKGISNAGRVLSLYSNGDPVIIQNATDLTVDWSYYEITFTANTENLFLVASDWGVTELHLDNITLKDADGVDLLEGIGDFWTEEGEPETTQPNPTEPETTEPETTEPETTEPETTKPETTEPETTEPETTEPELTVKVPITIDTSRQTGAYQAYEGHWVPMYPAGAPDSGTWAAWNTGSHYAEIVEAGHYDVGALHLKSNSGKNVGVAIKANMVLGQSYTLGLWAKGTSNSGRVLALYANGDPAIIGSFNQLSADWKYHEITFTANVQQINLMAADWGVTDMYVDNITLKGADGVDLLSGYGDFFEEKAAPGMVQVPMSIDTSRQTGAYQAYEGHWVPMYPAGSPDSGTWAAWNTGSHYAEIVEAGHYDVGALHLKSNSGKNVGVAIKANMVLGQSYTLGLWAKGTSNSGRVLALYANGDPAIIGSFNQLSADWKYHEITFTANVQQINLMAADWGVTDMYVDNITLKGADGVDLLEGYGNLYTLTEAAGTMMASQRVVLRAPLKMLDRTVAKEKQSAFLDMEHVASHGMAYDGWAIFYPWGETKAEEFWPEWTEKDENGDHYYAEVVEEGYKNDGALHFSASNIYAHMAVSINTTMRIGQTYTLGFWAKFRPLENSVTNDVLRTYANGDVVILGTPEGVSVENDGQWHYVEREITASDVSQLTLWWRAETMGGDLWIDNITLRDRNGNDLLQYRGDFCERTPGQPHPDESVNLFEGGDFENVAALSVPGWIITGTAVMENGAVPLKNGASLQSLRYHVKQDQILMAKWVGSDGTMQLQLGADDAVIKTYAVDAEGQIFSVPAGVDWIRVKYSTVDKPATISKVELIDMGDPSNLDFELKSTDSDLPLNWTTWYGINDPGLTAENAEGSYSVMHQEGTGIDGSNALYIKQNKDIPQNLNRVGLSAVVDSIKIAVEPNTTYSFSYYAKMEAENGCIYPSVKCYKADGSEDGMTQWMNGAFCTDASGQWKQYKTTFSTGENTTGISFRLEVKATNAGAQFWVDRLTFKAMGSSLDPNLDFELGEEGLVPLNWTTYERDYKTNLEGAFGTYTAELKPTGSFDGSGALKVEKVTDTTTELYVCSTMLKVDPSSSYYFSYDAATTCAAAGDQIMMMLRQKQADGSNVADESKAFYWPTNAYATGHFNWSDYGAIFETAADCAYIQIMFCFRGSKGYTAFVDNVALTKTDKIEDPNLDFEYSVGKIPLNWSFNGVLSNSSMSVYAENVYSGNQTLRVTRENGELDCSFVYSQKMIPVKAGDKIEVVANIASRNAVSGHFSMCFFGYGTQQIDTAKQVNSMYGQQRITNAGEDWSQWDTYEMVWTVPKGVNYIQLCLRVGGTCNDMLIDDITVYNYTQSDNLIYSEHFKTPSVTTGLPGGWEKGEITGTGKAQINGQMSLTGNEASNVEVFTKLYSLKTDYVYTLAADVFTTGTATGQLIMEAVNWNGTVAGQPVVLELNTDGTDQELKANFEALSAVYYRLILRKTGGNGSVCISNITLHQSGEPYNGITWAGKWLTHPDETARIANTPHPFTERHYFCRTEINLDKPVETAQMQITADDKFTLYINGMQVYEETRTGDTWDLPVTLDIAQYLTQGKNVIAVDMFNNIYLYGLLFDGIVKMEDESSLRFYSTSDTMMAAGSLSNEIVPTPNSLWTEEDQLNWMQVDYDISTCPLWVNADEYASIGGGGWGDLDFDPTEYSDYKIFSNEFTFPDEDITAGDTARVTAQLMLEKELPTTNSFQVNIWKRNTTSRVCSGVMTIADGKTTDDWPVGQEFTAEFDLLVPMFLAEGSYTIQLESTVSIVSDYFINNKVGNMDVVQIQRPLTTTSSIEVINGKATMIVNGEPKAPLWYARPERPSQFEEHIVTKYAEVGVDTIVSYIFLNNVYGDIWTKEGFVPDLVDSMMLDTLAGNPEAQLIIALDFNVPDWWKEENPGELAALENTSVTKTGASFASQKWKEESGRIMLEAIDHMMSQPYANNIIGFKVTGGYTLEWNWWASSGVYDDVADFSQCGIDAFRSWLTKKYGTDEALQEAWGNREVTLETVMPPSKENREDKYWDTVASIQDMPDFMDYELYMAEVKADTIEYFSKLIKDHTDDRLIVGTYGGYFFSGGGYEFSSATSNVYFQKMLQSENIDFIKSPWMYGMREVGATAQFMGPMDSLDLYGKLWIIEEDSRLNRKEMAEGQDGRAAVGWTRNYQQSVEQIKRNFSYILSKGMGVSFYNLMWDFFDDDQYYGAIGQMYEEMTLSMGLTNESVADIAVIVDGESQMLIPWEPDYLNHTLYNSIYTEQLVELGFCGAPYDVYLLDDLKDGLVPEHKIYFFLATTNMTEEERAAVRKLQKNGNILIWQFTDGIANGEKTELALMEEIIGMDLSVVSTKRKQIATSIVFDNAHWLTQGMNEGQPYGVESYDTMSPVIAVTDSSAKALAYHSTTSTSDGTPAGQVSLAVKELDGWTSVYSAVPNMPQIMFRNILKKAGCHTYTESGSDVVYANNHYVALHSLFAGERTVELPDNATVYDVFNRKIISTDTDSFTVTLSGKETRLFRITEPETVQVYIGQNNGGSVSNKGLTNLKPGEGLSFTVEAEDGYRLSYLLMDGQKVFLEGDTYTFENIQESHTVLAHFSPAYGAEEAPPAQEETPQSVPQSNRWLLPALIGSLLLLAVLAAVVVLRKRKK